jgi:hypothetical protein
MPIYTIRSKTYGKALMGRQILYRGFRRKPAFLRAKGQGFPGGKHLLETLDKKFKTYRLVLTPKTDAIRKKGKQIEVLVSEKTMKRFDAIVFEKSREMKLDAIRSVLGGAFPGEFESTKVTGKFKRDLLSEILVDDLDPRLLSMEDVRAVTSFAARIAADPKAIGMDEREIVKRTKSVQLIYLRKLIAEFEARLEKALAEGDWQSYFAEKILYFQDNYIKKIPKLNIATVTTQFPDFGVVTADDYLDLIEIKLPKTTILNEDLSHNSFYWSAEVTKAIAQVETYIDSVASRKFDLTVQIEQVTGLKLKIVKPRGIIIAGMTTQFAGNSKKADYFRMLNEGLKNVEIVPYDELSRRLRNTMTSIEKLEAESPVSAKRRSGKELGRKRRSA